MTQPQMTLLKGTLDVLILKTLSWGPSHGYAISRWIRQATADELTIEEGALYPALRRLDEKGLVESTWQTTATGREAKVYELTAAGRTQLRTEVSSWRRYVAAMSRALEARPSGAIG